MRWLPLPLAVAVVACSPKRVYLEVRDPSRVAVEADTPEGRVVILAPGATAETRPFTSVDVPYVAGNNPVRHHEVARLSGGAIRILHGDLLTRQGELRTFRRYGNSCTTAGATTGEAPESSGAEVRISFCMAPWTRPCLHLTLVTPRDNVVRLEGPSRAEPSVKYCAP